MHISSFCHDTKGQSSAPHCQSGQNRKPKNNKRNVFESSEGKAALRGRNRWQTALMLKKRSHRYYIDHSCQNLSQPVLYVSHCSGHHIFQNWPILKSTVVHDGVLKLVLDFCAVLVRNTCVAP
eukprot:6186323-Pleurochrysis_carterae.AAC.1